MSKRLCLKGSHPPLFQRLVFALALASCGKKAPPPDLRGPWSASSQPAGVTPAEELKKIEWSLEHGRSVTMNLILDSSTYPKSMQKFRDLEKRGLLHIDLNPNSSESEIDVAPFIVATFTPEFFDGLKPEELASSFGILSLEVDRLQLPPALASEPVSEANKGYMPVESMKARRVSATGKGVTVAIIDSGVDVGHPFLTQTPSGRPKVIDFVDFTRTGDFDLSPFGSENDAAQVRTMFSNFLEKTVGASQIQTSRVFSTVIRERRLYQGVNVELDFSGDGSLNGEFRAFVMLLPDGRSFVAIDTNQNGTIESDELVQSYVPGSGADALKSSIPFGSGRNRGVRKVVASVDSSRSFGKTVLSLGVDEGSHGTHVAGIVAGAPLKGGEAAASLMGVAPEAQIMALKVCHGSCSSSAMVSAMIYAAQHGAQIANMSLGSPEGASGSILAQMMRFLSQKYGILFVVAAGNSGPAIDTAGDPGNFESVLTVGAYNPPESQRDNFGLAGMAGSLFWWSSRGPTRSGALKPNVVAPGAALSSTPTANGPSYQLFNGTSMAAPMVSGLAALVLESGLASDNVLLKSDAAGSLSQRPLALKRALEEGAAVLPNYEAFEQGYGLVQAPASLEKLAEWNLIARERLKQNAEFRLFKYFDVSGNFVQTRGGALQAHELKVVVAPDVSLPRLTANFDVASGLDFVSKAGWISLRNVYGQPKGSGVNGVQEFSRNSTLSYEIDETKLPALAIASGFVEFVDTQTGVPQGRILVTTERSVSLTSDPVLLENGISEGTFVHRFGLQTVKAGENKRYFVRVPKGVTGLGVKTRGVTKGSSWMDAQIVVTIAGQGKLVVQDLKNNLKIRGTRVAKSEAFVAGPVERDGVYEIVVTGSSSLPESNFELEVRASGLAPIPMVFGMAGSANLRATDQIRDVVAEGASASASPWMVIENIPILDGNGKDIHPTVNMGSVFYIPTKLRGAVRPFAKSATDRRAFYSVELLNEARNPMIEGTDYLKDPTGFWIFAKESNVVLAVRPISIDMAFDTLSLGLNRLVMTPPLVKVGVVDGQYLAQVSSGGSFSTAALTILSWKDTFLGGEAPIRTSIIVNLPKSDGLKSAFSPRSQDIAAALAPLVADAPEYWGALKTIADADGALLELAP